MVSDRLFCLGRGSDFPFLNIPSPSELQSWSQAPTSIAFPQGNICVSSAGLCGTTLEVRGTSPPHYSILRIAVEGSSHLAPATAYPSGFFNGISRQDTGPEENRSLDSNKIPHAEIAPTDQQKRIGERKKSKLSKFWEHDWLLVFGAGITMAQVALKKSTVLVGKVRGRNYTLAHLRSGPWRYGVT